MRALPLLILIPLAACSAPSPFGANIPAPWEAAESPHREPNTTLAPAPQPSYWERIGSSVRGKPILAATVGSGPRRVYLIGGIHGDEPEGPAAAAKLPELLALEPLQATVRILRDVNPDGSAAHTRTNTRGVDLNRNWPARDYRKGDKLFGAGPASELETVTVQKDLAAFKPDLVIVISSSVRGPVVAFEGPGQTAAYEFASAARAQDPRWRMVPDRWKPSPGSVESYTWLNLRRPVLSLELPRAGDAAADAQALRAGLLGVAANWQPTPAVAAGGSARPAPVPSR